MLEQAKQDENTENSLKVVENPKTSETERCLPKFNHIGSKLTQDSDFDLWSDKVMSEIRARDLGWTIENSEMSEAMSVKQMELQQDLVRNFIIRHLDENHH